MHKLDLINCPIYAFFALYIDNYNYEVNERVYTTIALNCNLFIASKTSGGEKLARIAPRDVPVTTVVYRLDMYDLFSEK